MMQPATNMKTGEVRQFSIAYNAEMFCLKNEGWVMGVVEVKPVEEPKRKPGRPRKAKVEEPQPQTEQAAADAEVDGGIDLG